METIPRGRLVNPNKIIRIARIQFGVIQMSNIMSHQGSGKSREPSFLIACDLGDGAIGRRAERGAGEERIELGGGVNGVAERSGVRENKRRERAEYPRLTPGTENSQKNNAVML